MKHAEGEKDPQGGLPTLQPIGQGGLIPAGIGDFGHAFEVFGAEPSILPVVIAVPHAGRAYAPDVLASMRQPEMATLKLEDRLVDALGHAIAKATGAGLLVARAPRAMIDLNRHPQDVDWDMLGLPVQGVPPINARARSGLGLVPRRLPAMGDIWRGRMTRDMLDARIKGIHQPYHDALGQMLEATRQRWGAALLIDLHSMPPLPPELGGTKLVLGDRFGSTCHPLLVAGAFAALGEMGCPALHNRPYAGGYVLDRHGRPRQGIHAIQIEVDRAAYLDSRLEELGEGVGPMTDILTRLVLRLAQDVARIGGEDALPQAAE
jgi:N-formylglutamate amidohydrolase